MAIRIDCDSHFLPKDVFDDVDPRFEHRRPQLFFDARERGVLRYPEREANLSHHQRHVAMASVSGEIRSRRRIHTTASIGQAKRLHTS